MKNYLKNFPKPHFSNVYKTIININLNLYQNNYNNNNNKIKNNKKLFLQILNINLNKISL